MGKKSRTGIFDADQRIRLGIWGLGRGMSFFETCQALNMDVVAGCDFNEHMRMRFRHACPEARVTGDAEEFLNWDFDAVLLATYCPEHGPDAVRCLEAGKHVLSEVTAFHTPAEGVKLVETVTRTKRVYNLAENYGYSAPHMVLAEKWQQGLFGQLMYAEGEYVHEVRSLCYTYIDGVPVVPGHALHNWRSWLNFHYYCTHSLGPILFITRERPIRVVALPGAVSLPGYPSEEGLNGIAPSLISMSHGALVRNLMGATTNDVHQFRYWGTKGSAEVSHGDLIFRLGGTGGGPRMKVKTDGGELTSLAAKTGHGGGDFWTLYFFARQILFGEPAFFGVHAAADVTLPGILAYRSSLENGRPFDVPDFRKKSDRDKYRGDTLGQPRLDVSDACFPKQADSALIGKFTSVMAHLLKYVGLYRAYADWMKVSDAVVEPAKLVDLADKVIASYQEMVEAYDDARVLADVYPKSKGGQLLLDMLDDGDEEVVTAPSFLSQVKKARQKLAKRLTI